MNNKFLSSKKGFGGVVSTLIMFIAIVGLSTGVVISFQQYIGETQNSMNVQNDISSNKLKTMLSISSIDYNSTSQELYLYIKNIGETTLRPERFDLFINDDFTLNFTSAQPSDFTINKTLLMPQETVVIIKQIPLSSGSNKVKVVSEYGVGEENSFNI